MERLKGFKKIAYILFMPIVIIGLMVYTFIKMNRINDSLSKEYILIEKMDSINGVITSIFNPDGFRMNPYAKYIVLSNGDKRTLIAAEDEFQRTISLVIEVGTIIKKKKNNDTVYLSNINQADTITSHFKILNRKFE